MISLSSFVLAATLAAAPQGVDESPSLPADPTPVLNVVLVELADDPPPDAAGPIHNDWEYWQRQAGNLLVCLEDELGYSRAVGESPSSAASLFAIRVPVAGLEDAKGLAPLLADLDEICGSTSRPSLLVVWVPRDGIVFLSMQDQEELKAGTAIAMLGHLSVETSAFGVLASAGNAYVAPPCVLARSRHLAARSSGLGGVLRPQTIEMLQHCLVACEWQLILGARIQALAEATPAGTARMETRWNTLTSGLDAGTLSQRDLNNFVKDLAVSSPATQNHYLDRLGAYRAENPGSNQLLDLRVDRAIRWNNTIAPLFQLMPDSVRVDSGVTIGAGPFSLGGKRGLEFGGIGIGPTLATYTGRNVDMFTRIQNTGFDPAGILLTPDLEIVVDPSGLAGGLADGAVGAVEGEKDGGEFTIEGTKYIAARTPGTARMFEVDAGVFRFEQIDLSLSGDALVLERTYDSSVRERSPLGPGWTFLPYSLRLGQVVEITEGQPKASLKPILIDHRAGSEMAYRLEELDPASQDHRTATALAGYRAVTSSLQPALEVRKDGTYLADLAHGLRVSFDRLGRLEWIGRKPGDRIHYVFSDGRLVQIRGQAGSIELDYDESGRLEGAQTSDGQEVAYLLDPRGRLLGAVGGCEGELRFEYGADGLLARIWDSAAGEESPSLVVNTYDSIGRMLTHHEPRGLWRFRYDDKVGQMDVEAPDGVKTAYFYDGNQRLVAHGSSPEAMTLLNYDVTGRILQVATGELTNQPRGTQRPEFHVSDVITPASLGEPEQPETEDSLERSQGDG